ncbi:E3 ubiquitin ligase SCF complex subunit SKP1/ASK1 family protein [Tripterygium wilfordii]|uniref:E3 ubiquitin ligase SCF complex subunit SKP1/ASK1 family protein n=1 Tax=Tripterygium wilfordii TaxID=458696 RepID=A0A7J7D5R4_TRIWF|nr:E3 ubiquitin ligase SCF complex subunit SKP1/ASK1 family protein [Tripterygium wilfordii]
MTPRASCSTRVSCAEFGIPTPNVSSAILVKVLGYCKKHVESSKDEHLTAWDAEFVIMDKSMLLDLTVAANYLDIKDLLELICQAVATRVLRRLD